MRISRKAKALGASATLLLALGGGALILGGGTAMASSCNAGPGVPCNVPVSVQIGASETLYVGYSSITFPTLVSGSEPANPYVSPDSNVPWISGSNGGNYTETEEVISTDGLGYLLNLSPGACTLGSAGCNGTTLNTDEFLQSGSSYTVPNSDLSVDSVASSVASGGTSSGTVTFDGSGQAQHLYSTNGLSQPTGDIFNDTWTLNTGSQQIASGAYNETFDYVLSPH